MALRRPHPDEPLLVSACLLGGRCRYDGATKASTAVAAAAESWTAAGGLVVTVCPEQLGGLPTPRPPADLRGGDGQAVLDGRATVSRVEDGGDVTEAFVAGAERSLEQAPAARIAVLKARSPSCGIARTEIDGAQRPGDGVFAALLRRRSIELIGDEEL
ncbi:MAG: DUF523 domain-containing protein [Deltaproteobacteria bacterium]|jgi:uncharacterized protein YbbK (DUF523 family)|nr:DUF523 domain-containing protein [Deltaproteobacteria bacterium]MBW2531925.1 DUF523 domain-containing protein [Deltaproteobacteria bacterium]